MRHPSLPRTSPRRAGALGGVVLVLLVLVVAAAAWYFFGADVSRPATDASGPAGAGPSVNANGAPLSSAGTPGERRATPPDGLPPTEALDQQLRRVHGALVDWAAAHDGHYPATLAALTTEDQAGRRYLLTDEILDPWGRPLVYVAPSNRAPYQLHSFGRDGRPGGTGEDADRFIADLLPE